MLCLVLCFFLILAIRIIINMWILTFQIFEAITVFMLMGGEILSFEAHGRKSLKVGS